MSHEVPETTALAPVTTDFLTIPTTEFVSNHYLQPLVDDSWIRKQELVRLEDLKENEGGEKIKRELLEGYKHKKRQVKTNPILDGMKYQEMFFTEYSQNERYTDQIAAEKYKARNLENFRKKHPSTSRGEVEEVLPSDSITTIQAAVCQKLDEETDVLPIEDKKERTVEAEPPQGSVFREEPSSERKDEDANEKSEHEL